jgi:peptidoglycan/xylan/chitin deacetylase (PgdA/CDA1 family)
VKHVKAALRSDAVLRTATAASRRHLRVLAYHDVPDPQAFAAQLSWLVDRFTPVDADRVTDAAAGRPLPPRAVWITFDDGDPSVVEHGLPVLERHGIRATMFVCPGLIGTDTPFWWEAVATADTDVLETVLARPVPDRSAAIADLKLLPDDRRRALVGGLEPSTTARRAITEAQLDRWIAAGQDVGNHTWDHPCLDRCTPEEQRHQIRAADEWLRRRVPGWRPRFAYPNGNWVDASEAELAALGYELALLHDHRLAGRVRDRLRVSRLHVEATDPVDRFASIVAGVQPALWRFAGAIPGLEPPGMPAPRG